MKSIDEAIGPTQPYVTETVGTTTERTAEMLMDGLSDGQILRLIQATIGLYLTGKTIIINLSRKTAITTRDDVIYLSPAIAAPFNYVNFPRNPNERIQAIHDLLDAAIEFKFIGEAGRLLMLTGKGFQTIDDLMKKEAMYS